ncbi:efflux transporter outer membrane subunit [Caulobacter endophyticus]|uniref:Fusaric acid resistance protein n=1 Tax=Caulobacter endophyticus TaxID=2172652 RepID=A0A2T9JEK2_9CAUL|nr:efflux transporter outer membrane subunit [Caulobacter endophyticus]PVM82131.1 fusaric acid resistance protein [Caulobacter endophyticus]
MRPTRRTARAALAALLVSTLPLVGCAGMGGVAPSQARLTDPSRLAASRTLEGVTLSPAAWPASDWWKRYGDPQLDALVAEVLADNPSLGAAQARIDQALALSGAARAAQNLQANLNAKATQQRFSGHSTTPHPLAGSWDWFNDATLATSYDLDFWGKNKSLIEASLDRLHASQIDSQAARLMLAYSTTQVYFRLAQAHDQLDLAESVVKQREDTLELVRQRVAAGLDSTVDLKQAQAALPPARQQVLTQREAVDLARSQLAALTGKGPDRGRAVQRPSLSLSQTLALPADLPAELLGRRPDVVAQRWRVEASAKDIKAAKAQFYPNISLNAYVGSQSLGLDHWVQGGSAIAGIGPALTLPIFDGGRLRANLGARNAEHDLAVEQYNQTLVEAMRDVVDQITAQQWFDQQRAEQVDAVETAEAAYDLAIQRYRSGLTPYLQVLIAQSQVFAQRKQLIDLQVRALQLDANLARALGGGVLDS